MPNIPDRVTTLEQKVIELENQIQVLAEQHTVILEHEKKLATIDWGADHRGAESFKVS